MAAKDAQGMPTKLQQQRMLPQGPLSHCGEHIPCTVPTGYRLMPDDERQQSLKELESKLGELDDQYRRLPLRIETEGQRKQQEMLRHKIAETERAVGVFSRQSVIVEM